MIFLMSEKQFLKAKKKLVEPKDYLIIDSTEDDNGELSKFSNTVTIEGFNPPSSLVKLKSEDSAEFDVYKVEKLEAKFFKGDGFVKSSMAVTKGILANDCNAFIVLSGKVYKYYAKTIRKRIQKTFDVSFDFVYLFSDIEESKKLLSKSLKPKHAEELAAQLKKLEKETEATLHKKKKHKNDDGDKKKKKKKKKD